MIILRTFSKNKRIYSKGKNINIQTDDRSKEREWVDSEGRVHSGHRSVVSGFKAAGATVGAGALLGGTLGAGAGAAAGKFFGHGKGALAGATGLAGAIGGARTALVPAAAVGGLYGLYRYNKGYKQPKNDN